MSEKQIHLIVTPQQAKVLLIAARLSKEMLALPPNTPLYPNLGDFQLERELMKAEVNAAHETLLTQMKEQMPNE